jgi:PiT family inorganic phosphate transporter
VAISTIIIFVISAALIFEFINGFHDTANAIATSIFTHALTPTLAILMASCMNFIGALASERVAKTISSGLIGVEIQEYVVLAALLGAIAWNLITWWFGFPSSSSHALIGGLVGAALVYQMSASAIIWKGVLMKVVIPLFISPLLGFLGGFAIMKLIFLTCRRFSAGRINAVFLRLQVCSAAFMAFSHGNNDAQKTMGIITLALVSGEFLPSDTGIPIWVKIICAVTMALGTAAGGWRIIKTVGHGVTKLRPPGGFSAETAAACGIEFMTSLGAPISTTHTITSAVMGVGAAKRLSAVKWGKAKDIVLVWIVTLPICATLGGLCCWLIGRVF